MRIRQLAVSITFDLGRFEMRLYICVFASIIRLRVIIHLIVHSYYAYMYDTHGVVDVL